MPDVSITVEAPWDDGAPVAAQVEVPWDDATAIGSTGGAWTAPPAPPGGTPTGPNTVADFVIPRQAVYDVVHTVEVIDLRDGLPVEFASLSMSCDQASVCWTLNASGPAALFERLTSGDELPMLRVTVDGMQWLFVAESVQRAREFAGGGVSVTGRSVTITAGEPYQYTQNWVNDGPTTAAQIAEQAQVFTGLEVEWQLDDWPVPDRVWTFSGSPLAVVQRVAESVGAVLRSDRLENRIAVMPRYRILPNEWPEVAPDVDIHVEAAMTDSFERADRPAYDGIYVSGQQQGVTCLIKLAGTAGLNAAPLVTDLLLTDTVAAQQRGTAELGASGPQATVRMSLPVLVLSMVPPLQFDNWQWVALQLATPVVLWGAWPFHRAAWTNLRHGAATMDTLVSIGTLAAWGWSVVALLWLGAGDPDMRMPFEWVIDPGAGADHIYLEVATVVTTFLLAGRWFEARAKRRAGAALRALLELGAKEASVLGDDGRERRVAAADVAVGDRIVVRPGERVAADGVVEISLMSP